MEYTTDMVVLSNMSIIVILILYLIFQAMVTGMMYLVLKSTVKHEISKIFHAAGYEFFVAGFDTAARESLMVILKDNNEQAIMTAELAINTAKELSLTTANETAVVNAHLEKLDKQFDTLRITFDKVDQMYVDMHDTNVSIAELHSRLTTFFEQHNANK